MIAAILAGEPVPQENVEPGKCWVPRWLHICLERHNTGQFELEAWTADNPVILGDDVDPIKKYRLDRVLPAPERQRIVAQGTIVRIEHEGRAGFRRDRRELHANLFGSIDAIVTIYGVTIL